jgi:hypothetical protein
LARFWRGADGAFGSCRRNAYITPRRTMTDVRIKEKSCFSWGNNQLAMKAPTIPNVANQPKSVPEDFIEPTGATLLHRIDSIYGVNSLNCLWIFPACLMECRYAHH